MKNKFQFKTFKEFINSKKGIKIGCRVYNDEEFKEIMKPIINDMCNRFFNPNANLFIKQDEINKSDYTWEVITKYKRKE